MSNQLQLRRGTTSQHATFTGAVGEVTVDTTKDVVVVHDGATAGGFPMARQDLSNVPAGTITQSMLAANVVGRGPAFAANQGAGQTVSNGVNTKCAQSNEVFDTNANFNATGSTVGGVPAYAFLPTVAGFYQVNAFVSGGGSTSTGRVIASVYKNGAAIASGSTAPQSSANVGTAHVSTLVFMNGTTDYLELYGNVEGSGTLTMNGALNGFSASLARSAT
jgi:hypothetical protein